MSKRTMIYAPQSVGVASKLAYSASAPASLPIGSQRFVLTGLLLTFEVSKYWDTTTEVPNQDWLMRMVSSLYLQGGGHNYLSLTAPDLRILYWHHRMRVMGRDRVPDYVVQGTAGTPKHLRYTLPILFNPSAVAYDDTENLDGRLCGIRTTDDLQLSLTFGAATAFGTHSTILGTTDANASYIRVSYLGYIPSNDSELPLWYPQWAVRTYVPTQTYPGLGLQTPVTTGQWARRTAVMILNGATPADVRTNGFNSSANPIGGPGGTVSAASEVGFIASDGREPISLKTPDFAALSQAQFQIADDNTEINTGSTNAFGVATAAQHVNPGVGLFDWAAQADFADPNIRASVNADFGVNLTGKGSLALNTVFTIDTATNTNIVQLDEQYNKYPVG